MSLKGDMCMRPRIFLSILLIILLNLICRVVCVKKLLAFFSTFADAIFLSISLCRKISYWKLLPYPIREYVYSIIPAMMLRKYSKASYRAVCERFDAFRHARHICQRLDDTISRVGSYHEAQKMSVRA